MSKTIPYYDPADGRLLNFLTLADCERYVASGHVRVIKTKRGEIMRAYRAVKERTFANSFAAAGQLSNASKTTVRLRNGERIAIAPPWILAHSQHQAK